MHDRKWVVNASPVILLGDIGHLYLFAALCAELVIPDVVADEIRAGPCKDAAQRWLQGEGASYIQRLEHTDTLIAGWDLGAGESAVLTWVRRYPGYEAILDDRAARKCAATLHIPVRGTLGVLLLAKREGLIPRVRPAFDLLVDVGMRITPEILHAALRLANEEL